MAIRNIEGFDQYQGQVGATLLNSLTSAGFVVTNGLAMAAGRKAGNFALELQVSPGAGGASWSARNNTSRFDLYGVASNSTGRAVAVGIAGAALTSVDSIQWSPVVLGVADNMYGISCRNNTFIAVGENGAIMRSTDGQNWSKRAAPASSVSLRDVAWGDGKWVAVGNAGPVGVIIVSTDDGLTWANVTNGPGARGNECVRFGDVWMAGGIGGQLLTSVDALTWTTQVTGTTSDFNGVAFYNGTWAAATGLDVRRSANAGVTWSIAAAGVSTAGLRTIEVSNGRWIVGGDQGNLWMSDDTTTWVRPSFLGAASSSVYDINVTTGANIGWFLVGSKIGIGTNATAMVYVSLAPPTRLTRTLNSEADLVVIGFAHRATARGRIFSINGLLDVDWPAAISILGVSGAAVPIRNTWYFYEIVIDKAANTVSLYINDTLDITAPLPAAGAIMTAYTMSWQTENGAVALVDDIYLLDSSTTGGSALVDRLGPVSIPLRMPTADSEETSQWSPAAPGAHWPNVAILPPSPTSFIRSAESGAQDLFLSDTELPPEAGTVDAPILAVGLIALAQKSDLDNRQLGLVIGEFGNQKEVIDTQLAITMEYSTAIFETDPDDQPWTVESVLATPFGVAVRP